MLLADNASEEDLPFVGDFREEMAAKRLKGEKPSWSPLTLQRYIQSCMLVAATAMNHHRHALYGLNSTCDLERGLNSTCDPEHQILL